MVFVYIIMDGGLLLKLACVSLVSQTKDYSRSVVDETGPNVRYGRMPTLKVNFPISTIFLKNSAPHIGSNIYKPPAFSANAYNDTSISSPHSESATYLAVVFIACSPSEA